MEAVRAAALLGWLSVAAVLVGIVVGLPVRHESVVLVTTALGAAGHAALGLLPWSRILPTRRGRLLLDAWSVALLGGTAGLVVTAGGASRLDLLFFLVVSFLAMVHEGWRLVAWLSAAAGTFVLAAALTVDPLPRPEAVLHLVLLVAAAVLGRQLAAALRRQATARTAAIRRAELEGAMLAEGHHRVKNSLQVVADLLMLARPDDDAGGEAFDQAGARIRSIAAVHAVLASRSGGRVPADELLAAVVDAAHPTGTTLDVAPVALPFQQAQHVGVVVNELVTNAVQHGEGLVRVSLTAEDDGVVIRVADDGPGPSPERWAAPGLGLQLVRQVVQQGLRGTLEATEDGIVARFWLDDGDGRGARDGGGR
jgi:two-component sensor histidine kinase